MSRNKKGRWWYLAFKTLSLREILLPVVGFAISFVWIWNAAGQYLNLFKELQKPVVIQAEMSQNLSSDIRTSILSIQGVEALTPYSEQTAVMQWEDYSGEVSVYYVESDYMKWLSGQAVTAGVPFSEGMPYGIVSEKALENLKKKTEEQSRITSMKSESESAADENRVTHRNSQKDKKKQGLTLEKADLLKDFTLDDSQSVRLYGINQNEQLPGIYLSDQWADNSDEMGFTVSGGGMSADSAGSDMPADPGDLDMSAESAGKDSMNSKKSASTLNNSNSSKITERAGTDRFDRTDSTAAEEGQQVSVKLMIAVKNGFNVSPVIKELEQVQISAQSAVIDVIRQTNEKNISRLETGAMILICAIFMMKMSERVWKILHVRWLEDIRRFGAEKKGDRKLLHRRRLMIAGLGLIGSFAWQWISMLYGWL